MSQRRNISDVLNRFKSFDVFTKPLDDFQERTLYGGFVTLICWIAIIYVIIYECYDYMQVSWKEEIFVDMSADSKIQMHLDIVVPHISCSYLSLDAVDSSGDQHLQIEYNIYKRRLNSNGEPIEEPKKEIIKSKAENDTLMEFVTKRIEEAVKDKEKEKDKDKEKDKEDKCESCYGAETEKIKCCNTCAEVREAYRLKNWNFAPEKFHQCIKEGHVVDNSVFEEGCQIYGYMEVNRVGGSFHIAPGQSFSISHIHVHDVHPYSSTMFNTTHYIRHLSFGRKISSADGIQVSPLNGHVGTATEGAVMFQYFIKLIPTMVEKANGLLLHTNQFSVTKFSKKSNVKSGESSMPGIFFSYELSPLMVKRTEQEKSFGHLITTILSYVSGIYIAALLVDSFLHRTVKYFEKSAIVTK